MLLQCLWLMDVPAGCLPRVSSSSSPSLNRPRLLALMVLQRSWECHAQAWWFGGPWSCLLVVNRPPCVLTLPRHSPSTHDVSSRVLQLRSAVHALQTESAPRMDASAGAGPGAGAGAAAADGAGASADGGDDELAGGFVDIAFCLFGLGAHSDACGLATKRHGDVVVVTSPRQSGRDGILGATASAADGARMSALVDTAMRRFHSVHIVRPGDTFATAHARSDGDGVSGVSSASACLHSVARLFTSAQLRAPAFVSAGRMLSTAKLEAKLARQRSAGGSSQRSAADDERVAAQIVKGVAAASTSYKSCVLQIAA